MLAAVLSLGAGQVQGIDGLSRDAEETEDSTSTTTTLRLCITVNAMLPRGAHTALMREASAIWRRSGVELVWAPGAADSAASDRHLRVLVVDGANSAAPSKKTLAVAELLRPPGGEPIAMILINRGRHVVAMTMVAQPILPAQWNDNVLGVVLGRALAHEIGHFLLGTSTHAERGLMRSQSNANEFVDLRSGTFTLDTQATEWLANRARGDTFLNSEQAHGTRDDTRPSDIELNGQFSYLRRADAVPGSVVGRGTR